jgi:hypothetical protein
LLTISGAIYPGVPVNNWKKMRSLLQHVASYRNHRHGWRQRLPDIAAAEVGNPYMWNQPLSDREQDIRRLDIAVYDGVVMQVLGKISV